MELKLQKYSRKATRALWLTDLSSSECVELQGRPQALFKKRELRRGSLLQGNILCRQDIFHPFYSSLLLIGLG